VDPETKAANAKRYREKVAAKKREAKAKEQALKERYLAMCEAATREPYVYILLADATEGGSSHYHYFVPQTELEVQDVIHLQNMEYDNGAEERQAAWAWWMPESNRNAYLRATKRDDPNSDDLRGKSIFEKHLFCHRHLKNLRKPPVSRTFFIHHEWEY